MPSAYKTFANNNKERRPVSNETAAALDFEGAAVVVGGAMTPSVIAGNAWLLGVTST